MSASAVLKSTATVVNQAKTGRFNYTLKNGLEALFRERLPHLDHRPYLAAAHVFPFRVNDYVLNNHIDWNNVLEDEYFRLVFPQPGMLKSSQLESLLWKMHVLKASKTHEDSVVAKKVIRDEVFAIRKDLNPHPAGQKTENVPKLDGLPVEGMQHKYKQTALFFASEAQFCHAFCTYCFRWAQFVEVGGPQQFKDGNPENLKRYIATHPQIKDVLFTGGDPMVMSTSTMRRYVQPLLEDPSVKHLDTIRFGTKSLAYWPYRFTDDEDAKDLLHLLGDIANAGKHPTIQAHFTHPRELATPEVQKAMRLIKMTGANIRTQSPLIRGINDSASTWSQMWRMQTVLGAQPYYMFIERDTGAHAYFSVPLARAFEIYSTAKSTLSGIGRTANGPSMSAGPGKIAVIGIETISNEKVFILKFLQARNPSWIERTFFAKFDPEAVWLDDLKPAFGEDKFFYEDEYEKIIKRDTSKSSGQMTFESHEGCDSMGGGSLFEH